MYIYPTCLRTYLPTYPPTYLHTYLPLQVALFESIRPLFSNKQLIVVANKVDVVKMTEIKEADRVLIENLGKNAGVEVSE